MDKKRLELSPTEKDLLIFSAGDLIPYLASYNNLSEVKMAAYDYYDVDSKQVFQVQVIVTRREEDFIEPFEIVGTTNN